MRLRSIANIPTRSNVLHSNVLLRTAYNISHGLDNEVNKITVTGKDDTLRLLLGTVIAIQEIESNDKDGKEVCSELVRDFTGKCVTITISSPKLVNVTHNKT